MEGENTPSPNIYTGLEDARHASRGKDIVELGWNQQSASEPFPEQLRTLDIDAQVTQLAEKSFKRGENDIVILDIGSGRKGVLVDSFHDASLYPQTHRFLEKNKGFTIRVVGVTGAKAGIQQGEQLNKRETQIGEDPENLSLIISENYGYTITRAHTLESFLDEVNIDRIDTAFSTFALGYFTPANFERCLTDVSDKLVPGGSFYGITWDWVPAGFARSTEGGIHLLGKMSKSHPLFMVFDGHITDEIEFLQFEKLSPIDKVQRYLNSIQYSLDKGLIDQSQAVSIINRIIIKGNIAQYFDKWATPDQKAQLASRMAEFTNQCQYITPENWDQISTILEELELEKSMLKAKVKIQPGTTLVDLFAEVDETINRKYEERYHSQQPELPELKELQEEYRRVRNERDSYIFDHFADSKREVETGKIKALKADIEGSNWSQIAAKIEAFDPFTVAELWSWDLLLYELRELIIERVHEKTIGMKQAALERVSARDDLSCYFNSLNFLINKTLPVSQY